jgi:hypothetical protein
MSTNLNKTSKKPTVKRRLASEEGCLVDLYETLPHLFLAYEVACIGYNDIVDKFRPESRGRGFEATVFNTILIQAIQKLFPQNWKFGKYKRFILYKDGYLILPKKLDSNGMPMNIKTKMVESINQQLIGSLFEESGYVEDPILYFGYKRDKLGRLHSPQILYIDENKKKWTIAPSDLAVDGIEKIKSIFEPRKSNPVAKSPKLKVQQKKAANE